MLHILKILILSIGLVFFFLNLTWAELSSSGFKIWLDSYKKYALDKGVSQETIDTAFKNVKFLEQVIRYDRKQPEFYEDTLTYVNKRATISF